MLVKTPKKELKYKMYKIKKDIQSNPLFKFILNTKISIFINLYITTLIANFIILFIIFIIYTTTPINISNIKKQFLNIILY